MFGFIIVGAGILKAAGERHGRQGLFAAKTYVWSEEAREGRGDSGPLQPHRGAGHPGPGVQAAAGSCRRDSAPQGEQREGHSASESHLGSIPRRCSKKQRGKTGTSCSTILSTSPWFFWTGKCSSSRTCSRPGKENRIFPPRGSTPRRVEQAEARRYPVHGHGAGGINRAEARRKRETDSV